MTIKVGDKVCCLIEYHIWEGIVKKINTKSIIVSVDPPGCIAHDHKFKPEKVAEYDEMLCLVWELWKCKSSVCVRWERELYQQYQQPAKHWGGGYWYGRKSYKNVVEEQKYGLFSRIE